MKSFRVLSVMLIMVILASMLTIPAMAENDITVVFNGEKLSFDVPPQMIDDRTMVPMRKIFEELGATVEWSDSTQTINAKKDDINIEMQIDNVEMTVSGKKITLDVPPQLVSDRTLVPVRAVAEGLDTLVEWDESTNTVIIASKENPDTTLTQNLNANITAIDLNKETDFICNVGANITYGYDDMWYGTIGTGFDPYFKVISKAYRWQTILVNPLYANFEIDKNGKAKVTYTLKYKKPNGVEKTLIEDFVAFDGEVMPKQIIKAVQTLEYMIDDSDPLGIYTFIMESKDAIGNKTTTNTFYVDFSEYKYTENKFESDDELFDYICNYSKNPNPDRIIDAIVYAEKNEMLTSPVLWTGFIEMLAKNPYLSESATMVFEKEFRKDSNEALKSLNDSVSAYIQAIQKNNPPTLTFVGMPEEIKNSNMLFDGCLGVYFVSGSYKSAKALVSSLQENSFSNDDLNDYIIPALEQLIETDPLFKAYCMYMQCYDTTVSGSVKDKLKSLLQ